MSDIFFTPPNDKQVRAFIELAPYLSSFIDDIGIKELSSLKTEMNALADKIDPMDREALERYLLDCNRSYSEIFYVGKMVPVTESNYLSPGKLSNDIYADEAEAEYSYAGYKPEIEGCNEPADHIGFELGFLALMNSNLLKSLKNKNEENIYNGLVIQKNFLEKHLLKWLEDFCRNILKRKNNDCFFIYLIDILQYYVIEDYKIISEMIDMKKSF